MINWVIFSQCCVQLISSLGSPTLAVCKRLPELSWDWENPVHLFIPAFQLLKIILARGTELSQNLGTTCITIVLETSYHCSCIIWSHDMATPLEAAMTILMYSKQGNRKSYPLEAAHDAGAFSGQFLAGSKRMESVLHLPQMSHSHHRKIEGQIK